MRLSFSSDYIADTVLVDDWNRKAYATTSSTFGRHTEVLKFGSSGPSNLATINFHTWSSDTIVMNGQELSAKEYIAKPAWLSRRRVFTATNGTTFELDPEPVGYTWTLFLLNGPEVGRSHSRSLGFLGPAHQPYLELSDDPRVLESLDELIVTFVYLRIKQEKQRRNSRNAAHSHHHHHGGALSAANNVNIMQNSTGITGGGGGGMGGGASAGGGMC